MGREWRWDATLFGGAAAYYTRGRLPYAPGLADALAGALRLDGSGRLLDAGCGPGTVTLAFAPLFASAVGLDPDAEMLAEGRRLAAERGIDNIEWVRMRAEELPAGLGRFRCVTFAQSLHWMDRELVFATVRDMLEAGGAAIHVDIDRSREDDGAAGPHPAVPADAIAALVAPYLGPRRRAGQSFLDQTPGGEDEIFRAVGFTGPERVRVPDERVLERDVDDVVAGVFAASSSAPHLFGERVGAFEGELRALLVEASPGGRFSVRAVGNELKVWRVVD